jgi:heterodisulfide reductase subunit B
MNDEVFIIYSEYVKQMPNGALTRAITKRNHDALLIFKCCNNCTHLLLDAKNNLYCPRMDAYINKPLHQSCNTEFEIKNDN